MTDTECRVTWPYAYRWAIAIDVRRPSSAAQIDVGQLGRDFCERHIEDGVAIVAAQVEMLPLSWIDVKAVVGHDANQ